MRPEDQVTPCRCQKGKAEPNWAERAGIPKHYRGWRLDRWEPEQNAMALELAWVYATAWPPKPFLVFTGPVGTGKTALAVAIMYEMWGRHHVRSQFWGVTDLLGVLREAVSAGTEALTGVVSSLRKYPFLVLDDLGAERHTDFGGEQLYALINNRYAGEMPTVITSNVTIDGLDERISSRIQDFRLSCVEELSGPDRRRAA